jgi:hypothetical protein
MSFLRKLIMTVLAAVIVGSLIAGPAAARNRIEVSTTAALISFRELRFNSNLGTLSCDVTLHVTLRRLITKLLLSLAGHITSILTANPRSSFGGTTACRGLAPLPVFYSAISGTLPERISGGSLYVGQRSPEGLELQGFLIRLRPLFTVPSAECLYAGLIRSIAIENPIRRLDIDEEDSRVTLLQDLRGGIECPETGNLANETDGVVSPSITLRLLE